MSEFNSRSNTSANSFVAGSKENESGKAIDPVAQAKYMEQMGEGPGWDVNRTANKQEINLNDQPKGHAVTKSKSNLTYSNKNGKELRKPKVLEIEAGVELIILDDMGDENLKVRYKIDEVVYIGVIQKTQVNLSPNVIDKLDDDSKEKMRRITTAGSWMGPNAASLCYINYGTDLPIELHSKIENELDKHMDPSQALGKINQTVSLPVSFGALEGIKNLSEEIKSKYLNKTFVYRFTRFKNGNVKKGNKESVILVEELGEFDKTANISEVDKNRAIQIFSDYNLSFIEPGADASTADTELRSKFGTATLAELQALHAKAYLPLTETDKSAIYKGVSMLTEGVLNDIAGLKFGKKYCKIDTDDISKPKFVNAFYSSDNHEITLVNAGTSGDRNVFGDKGSKNFINELEFTVLHEIGHAADYGPERDDYDTDRNELKTKGENVSTQVGITNEAIRKYNKNKKDFALRTAKDKEKSTLNTYKSEYESYMRSLNNKEYTTKSGVGKKFIVNEEIEDGKSKFDISTSNIVLENDFKIALQADSPYITEYSYNFGKTIYEKEAFAESFALYFSEPDTLKALSPNVFTYFSNLYPR